MKKLFNTFVDLFLGAGELTRTLGWTFALILGACFLTAGGIQQTSPGGVSFPLLASADCVAPQYGFSGLAGAGICHDDGTGPYAIESLAFQTSDPTDFEYVGLQAFEGDPNSFLMVAFDDAGFSGVLISGRALGTVLGPNLSLDASDFVGGQTGSANVSIDAPDAGPYNVVTTITDTTGGNSCVTTHNVFGFTLCGKALASLGAPADGTIQYCTDCLRGSAACTGSSSGSIAKRENGAWNCD